MLLLALDCEAFGLDPARHPAYEYAWTLARHRVEDGELEILQSDQTMIAWPGAVISQADDWVCRPLDHPEGGGGMLERYFYPAQPEPGPAAVYPKPDVAARRLVEAVNYLADGETVYLLGAVPSFDDRRIGDLIINAGLPRPWHYHLIDIETLVRGYLVGIGEIEESMAQRSEELSRSILVDPDDFDRHTAAGDRDWVLHQYAAVYGLEFVYGLTKDPRYSAGTAPQD